MGISSSNMCSFCSVTVETISHLFWDCPITQRFISQLQNIILDNKIEITRCLFLFGSTEKLTKSYNFIFLLPKYFIFSARNNHSSLYLSAFNEMLKQIKITEQYMSVETKKFLTQTNNWNQIQFI